ncbi:integrase XerD family protein [Staphylococcus pseudintermedius]|nr:integrase XerD family protein [Staphylococcus pseudintermedius]
MYDRLIHFNPCDGIELKHKDLNVPQKAHIYQKNKSNHFWRWLKKRHSSILYV